MKAYDELPIWAPLLYVPADRPGLSAILGGGRPLGICTIAVCLEDAVRPAERTAAAENFCCALREVVTLPRPVFVRPANIEALDWLLDQPGIERVAGFVLPKATAAAIHMWIERSRSLFRVLPIMESRDALDPFGRRDLALACAAHRPQIPAARIGANDLFSLLGGLRRPEGKTIYETPVGAVISGLMEVFCAQEVRLCGPVFDRFEDLPTLIREVGEDIERGLFAKTAITPAQVEQIWRKYQPSEREIEEARKVLNPRSSAVFSLNGGMLEAACHSEWAKGILARSRIYHEVSQNTIRAESPWKLGGGLEDSECG